MKVWLDGERLIIAHRYGGCYGVVTVGNTGIDADEELSELPPGAVELEAELPEWHCPSCGAVTRARMADAAPVAVEELNEGRGR
jgi:hypothetical protein